MSRLFLDQKGLSWIREDSKSCNVETGKTNNTHQVIRLGLAANKTSTQ